MRIFRDLSKRIQRPEPNLSATIEHLKIEFPGDAARVAAAGIAAAMPEWKSGMLGLGAAAVDALERAGYLVIERSSPMVQRRWVALPSSGPDVIAAADRENEREAAAQGVEIPRLEPDSQGVLRPVRNDDIPDDWAQ